MQHCKCDTSSNKNGAVQMKWTAEPMNRYLIPINISPYNSHVYIKNETFFVELKVFCVGLGFLFRCSKLHSELSWRNKMDGNYGKKVHCGHKQRQRNACKFYFMHLNLHNENWMWCGRTKTVPLNALSSNNWLEIRCNETKNQGWMKTNKIQFYLVFLQYFPSFECSMNLLSSVICWS